MLRRSFRLGVLLGLLSGVLWALRKAGLLPGTEPIGPPSTDPWTPVAAPSPAPAESAAPAEAEPAPVPLTSSAPTKVARVTKPPAQNWVEGTGTVCPQTHPIKAKMSSRIFHLPGMLAYDRTRPDRCYDSEEAAESDGFTKAKR
jgi:hypothetical protein